MGDVRRRRRRRQRRRRRRRWLELLKPSAGFDLAQTSLFIPTVKGLLCCIFFPFPFTA